MDLTFEIPGDPIPKQRPRFRQITPRVGKPFVSTYTPKKSANYEAVAARWAVVAMRSANIFSPLGGPLELVCEFRFPVPKSWTKRNTVEALEGRIYPTSPRQDIDNCLKSIQDALNEIVWKDDGQVVAVHATKIFHARPAAIVTVRSLLGPIT